MSKWTSVKERCPAIGRLVIIYDGCCVMVGHLMQLNAGQTAVFSVNSGGGGYTSSITHWQEMPNPPSMYSTDGERMFYKGNPMSLEYVTTLLNLWDCEKVGED